MQEARLCSCDHSKHLLIVAVLIIEVCCMLVLLAVQGFVNIKLCSGRRLLPMKVLSQRANKYLALLRIGAQEVRSRTVRSDPRYIYSTSLLTTQDTRTQYCVLR